MTVVIINSRKPGTVWVLTMLTHTNLEVRNIARHCVSGKTGSI